MQQLGENYREYQSVDKSGWASGEWIGEPDKAQWIDADTGFDCLIVRNSGGALCGYVGVPEGHALFGKDYDSAPSFDAHGGLTFSGHCHDQSREMWEQWRRQMLSRRAEAARFPSGDAARDWKDTGRYMENYEEWRAYSETRTVCHVPANGRCEVWWFGFDCAHSGDISPAYSLDFTRIGGYPESYKNWQYVVNEVRGLAADIACWTRTGQTLEAVKAVD